MIPLSPLLVPATFCERRGPAVPSILDRPDVQFLSAARMALAIGLQLAGIRAGDEVLVPAYTSASLVTPILLHGAVPVFYRVRHDLSADVGDLARKVTPRSVALIAVNFFGFSQDWTALREFATQARLLLVEDCAHALYGAWHGAPLGGFGDFAIASLTKFLPAWDGGLLALNQLPAATIATHRPRPRTQLKALFNLLEEACDSGRNPVLRPVLRAMQGRRSPARPAVAPSAPAPPPSAPPRGESLRRDATGETDPARLLDAPTAISRLVAGAAARPRIARRRRQAYALYQEGLAGVTGCVMPFQPTAEEVPYMAPVWVDDLERLHPVWLEKRIPMQRFAEFLWPTMPADACSTARAMSRHLVQFPCHQDLEPAQIQTIVETIRSDLGTRHRSVS
jgi:dTDP-4-amino-4,6-dideoxygalactose transaminase